MPTSIKLFLEADTLSCPSPKKAEAQSIQARPDSSSYIYINLGFGGFLQPFSRAAASLTDLCGLGGSLPLPHLSFLTLTLPYRSNVLSLSPSLSQRQCRALSFLDPVVASSPSNDASPFLLDLVGGSRPPRPSRGRPLHLL